MNNETVIVYTYKYIWETSDSKMCVKILTGPMSEHEDFSTALVNSDKVSRCVREYLHEVNFGNLNKVEEIKEA